MVNMTVTWEVTAMFCGLKAITKCQKTNTK